jgi:membrane protein required for colicin V production
MSLTILDVIVIAVVLISALLAMVRGFVREVLSIASWVAAAAAAYFLYQPVLPLIRPYTDSVTVQAIVAAGAVFIVALIIATYITTKIADLVVDSRVGAVDRAFGFLFGAARGILLLVVALLFFNWLVNPSPPWVANAQTRPVLEDLGSRLIAALPQDLEATILRRLRGEAEGEDSEGAETRPNLDPASTATPNYSGRAQQGLDQLIQSSNAPTGN